MGDYNISENLKTGAFLTVKNKDKVNTMTIGWAFEGVIWQKNVFVVLVRESRYTYELLKDAEFFTVSFPKKGTFTEALRYFGTASGRDEDKYKSGLLTLKEASAADGCIVDGCEQNYECRILYRQKLEPGSFDDKTLLSNIYGSADMHAMFIGEILS